MNERSDTRPAEIVDTDPAGPAAAHWRDVYRTRPADQVSWFQTEPQPSLELVRAVFPEGPGGRAAIDVGGGASPLAAHLVRDGFGHVTVLDVSEQALRTARAAVQGEPGADAIRWLHADLLAWRPDRTFDLWHDRAVFHFLTDASDRAAYLDTLREALAPGGAVVLGTFGPEGPTHCSGLPVARHSPDELAAELGDAFTPVETRIQVHRTPAGASQSFAWLAARRR
ncbi:class I SAM-dependent methyltransferase [Actinomadura logoneensis]|uniref:Class I SAM-dependent methyltransferase n=1 Tax=Actinomadura logoneensis TaxID=2293572 RepID=A0A372JNZ4_9ACTN|nr:class I SAM-dependent methyltransferase [Actinomadura logoneensis]RFU41753.1 class I SAM-dependent methyltransferase [Actinomadura logoneensis]